jgi:hypothetical protein
MTVSVQPKNTGDLKAHLHYCPFPNLHVLCSAGNVFIPLGAM